MISNQLRNTLSAYKLQPAVAERRSKMLVLEISGRYATDENKILPT
jgi:hypothetical protein